jgi:hypothetical protein
MNTFSIILNEYYQSANNLDRFYKSYKSERVVATMLTELDAKLQAAEYNIKRTEGQYYSIRME